MERVVASVLVPCSYAGHGCTADVMAYHKMAEHEAVCPHAPCFCPEKGCGFAGTTAALVDHFTSQHKWPMTVFKYFEPFEVPVKAGRHVLCSHSEGKDDGGFFLLRVSWPESPVHVVSLLRVQPHEPESRFGCSVGFSWFQGHYQVTREDTITSTSLSGGMPTDYLCIVAEAGLGGRGRVVLSVTIDREVVYGDDYDKLFEEDGDDESYIYDEDEDDDGSSDGDESSEEEDDEEEEEDDDDGEEEGGDEVVDHTDH
jgi:E3 ubiquitin-protein ligase SIAH1